MLGDPDLKMNHPGSKTAGDDSSDTWRNSKEFKEWWGSKGVAVKWLLAYAGAAFWLAVVLVPLAIQTRQNTWGRSILRAAQVGLTLGAVIITIIVAFGHTAARRAFYERTKGEKSKATEGAVERLRDHARIKLSDLFVINRRQLDEYHTISVHEQRMAFRNAQIAATIGFCVLIIGIALSFRHQDPSARYTTAGLAGLGSLLSGFISGVFFKSYADTTKELRHYYGEPFRTGQILMAERLADIGKDEASPEEVKRLREMIVNKLVDQFPIALSPFDQKEFGQAGKVESPSPDGGGADSMK
ncbi:TRADD-N-associated membrane domain-containing protein [Streptomyces inhibens]|uniref:TRADD-N-associated membrane domain-containing protein n=1 Tax=Streptomyces inhibens TaxID=2293571 RepID=UPI000FFC11B2|nr:hypothetical protein [Streptomyces inhibens]